jgi:hypothetical protein
VQGGQARQQAAGLFADVTSEQARAAYLEKGMQDGSVLGEMPTKVLVRGVPAQAGQGYDVVFIRQIVEQARVDDLMRFTQDEAGQQRLMRLRELYGREQQPGDDTGEHRQQPLGQLSGGRGPVQTY